MQIWYVQFEFGHRHTHLGIITPKKVINKSTTSNRFTCSGSTDGSQLLVDFFDFMTAWKRHPFCRNCTSNFESGSFPGLANVLHPLSWFWAVATQCPCQPHNHEINEQHNEDYSGFHFQFSIQSVTGYSTLLGNRFRVRWSCPTVGWCKGCKHIYHGWGQRCRSQVYSIPFWLNNIFNLW